MQTVSTPEIYETCWMFLVNNSIGSLTTIFHVCCSTITVQYGWLGMVRRVCGPSLFAFSSCIVQRGAENLLWQISVFSLVGRLANGRRTEIPILNEK